MQLVILASIKFAKLALSELVLVNINLAIYVLSAIWPCAVVFTKLAKLQLISSLTFSVLYYGIHY